MQILADILLALFAALVARLALENSNRISEKIISASCSVLPVENKPELREQWLADSQAIDGDANRLIHSLGVSVVVIRILADRGRAAAGRKEIDVSAILNAAFMSMIYVSSRKIHLVHGSRAKPIPRHYRQIKFVDRLFLLKAIIEYLRNNRASASDLLLAKVAGNSFSHMGLIDGACLLALRVKTPPLDDSILGQLVIVDAPAANSSSGMRLRIVTSIDDGGMVSFSEHQDGTPLRPRPVAQICAIVLT